MKIFVISLLVLAASALVDDGQLNDGSLELLQEGSVKTFSGHKGHYGEVPLDDYEGLLDHEDIAKAILDKEFYLAEEANDVQSSSILDPSTGKTPSAEGVLGTEQPTITLAVTDNTNNSSSSIINTQTTSGTTDEPLTSRDLSESSTPIYDTNSSSSTTSTSHSTVTTSPCSATTGHSTVITTRSPFGLVDEAAGIVIIVVGVMVIIAVFICVLKCKKKLCFAEDSDDSDDSDDSEYGEGFPCRCKC